MDEGKDLSGLSPGLAQAASDTATSRHANVDLRHSSMLKAVTRIAPPRNHAPDTVILGKLE
jgi:hypothetical protein